MRFLRQPVTFEWDAGNRRKNLKHDVTDEECEEVFFDPEKRLLKDTVHSQAEDRYILVGVTKQQRLLFLVFTLRNSKVRVISARNLNQRERRLYEEAA